MKKRILLLVILLVFAFTGCEGAVLEESQPSSEAPSQFSEEEEEISDLEPETSPESEASSEPQSESEASEPAASSEPEPEPSSVSEAPEAEVSPVTASETQLPPASTAAFAIQMSSANGSFGRRDYAAESQIASLSRFLPKEEDSINTGVTDGTVLAVEVIHTLADGTQRDLLYYSQNYVVEKAADGAELWYATKSGVYEFLRDLTGWDRYYLGGDILYKGEIVSSVYSFLYKNRTYHRVYDPQQVKRIIAALEEKQPDETLTAGNLGFLIFTEKGARYPIYLDAASDESLVALSTEFVTLPSRIQWIAYMNPTMITSIQYSAYLGTYSVAGTTANPSYVNFTTEDPETIGRVSAYLKDIVITDTETSEQPASPTSSGDEFTMAITFSTGNTYEIWGTNTSLHISASNMEDQYITYTCQTTQLMALRDFISVMPGAQLRNI